MLKLITSSTIIFEVWVLVGADCNIVSSAADFRASISGPEPEPELLFFSSPLAAIGFFGLKNQNQELMLRFIGTTERERYIYDKCRILEGEYIYKTLIRLYSKECLREREREMMRGEDIESKEDMILMIVVNENVFFNIYFF